MKTIKDIKGQLTDVLKELIDTETNTLLDMYKNYSYEKQEAEKVEEEIQIFSSMLIGNVFEEESLPLKKDNNIIYYTISNDINITTVSYEIGENTEKRKLNVTDVTEIEKQILFDALKNGYIGILNNIVSIETQINLLKICQNEVDIKRNSTVLNTLTKSYNDNLEKMAAAFPNKVNLQPLKINNTLLPLPESFDPRAVQVASHVPNKEGTYRRSQNSHPYHQTDTDGIDIIFKNGKDFTELVPNKNEIFFTVKKPINAEVVVTTENSSVHNNLFYVKNSGGKVFSFDMEQEKKQGIFTKLYNNSWLTNEESLMILDTMKKEDIINEVPTLKFELNKFGNQIVEIISEKGETYNIGANASRVDKIIQYNSNHIKSSPKNNKSIVALKDDVLDHKNEFVQRLVQQMENKNFHYLHVNSDQLRANYPCLIVTFKKMWNDTTIIPEGYSEFVTHMMIAQINLKLKGEKLYPLIDRRQSFGFLTPTLTDVHTGVRLSIGLTPNQAWIKCVVEGINQTDIVLNNFTFYSLNNNFLDKFRGGELAGNGHKYLQTIYQNNTDEDNLKIAMIKFLDSKKDYSSGSSAQNIPFIKIGTDEQEIRTAKETLAKEIITKYYVFDEENNTIFCYAKDSQIPKRIFVDADKINYFLLQNISKKNIKLTEIQEEWLLEAIKEANLEPSFISVEKTYRDLYERIMSLYKKLINDDKGNILDESIDLEKSTRELITAQDRVVEFLLKQNPLTTDDTSDDDSDDEYGCKNYYSPAGMSALFAPLIVAKEIAEDHKDLPFPYSSDVYAYFELGLSWNKTLGKEAFIRSDLVDEKIKNSIFKTLLENKIGLKDDENKNSFFSALINDVYTAKLSGEDVTKESLLEKLRSNNVSITAELENACNLIASSLPHYLNMKDIEKITHPIVYYIDNNPCVNKDKITMRPALEILKDLRLNKPYPKVLVLDITSSTKKQVKDFLKEFNQQNDIPILVTASSMVKHSEFGLDLWQGGENKAYLSVEVKDKDLKIYFDNFAKKLKQRTQGTESGFGRFARRLIRETFNEEPKINSGSRHLVEHCTSNNAHIYGVNRYEKTKNHMFKNNYKKLELHAKHEAGSTVKKSERSQSYQNNNQGFFAKSKGTQLADTQNYKSNSIDCITNTINKQNNLKEELHNLKINETDSSCEFIIKC